MLNIKHSSKESFVNLLKFIEKEIQIKKVLFSQKSFKSNQNIFSYPARIDITLEGEKHIQYMDTNELKEDLVKPGVFFYSPYHSWKRSLWDTAHRMSSLVFCSEFIRITYIDNMNRNYTGEAAHVFYHTAKPLSSTGRAILRALDCYQETNSKSDVDKILMKALLCCVVEELENDEPGAFGKAHTTWLQINEYLKENFYYPINRAHVAKKFGLNPSYVSRLFIKEGNKRFTATLKDLRMEHAALLLKTTSLSASEICDQCGYLSSTYFIAAFKHRYGMSPIKYRCNNKGHNE